jgi:hypothetical protein
VAVHLSGSGRCHRAVIVNASPACKVLLLDVGAVVTVVEEVFYLLKQFADLPVQALHAKLYRIEPSCGEGDHWSGLSTVFFTTLVKEYNKKGQGLAVAVKAVEPQLAVILYTAAGVSLNQILVEKSLARATVCQ